MVALTSKEDPALSDLNIQRRLSVRPRSQALSRQKCTVAKMLGTDPVCGVSTSPAGGSRASLQVSVHCAASTARSTCRQCRQCCWTPGGHSSLYLVTPAIEGGLVALDMRGLEQPHSRPVASGPRRSQEICAPLTAVWTFEPPDRKMHLAVG